MVACIRCDSKLPSDKTYKCPSCGGYQFRAPVKSSEPGGSKDGLTVLLGEIQENEVKRLLTGPWDKAFGGGIPDSSVTLLGGMPGAGKTTLDLQIADAIACASGRECLYIATEQIPKELKAYGARLQLKSMMGIRVLSTLTGSEALGQLDAICDRYKPAGVMIDSLSGLTNDPNDQVFVCHTFKLIAVRSNCPVIIIDHITKSDDFAGLMKLQHEVDILLSLYVEEDGRRNLRPMKSRFGPSYTDTYLDMTDHGLVASARREDDEPEPIGSSGDSSEEEDNDETGDETDDDA